MGKKWIINKEAPKEFMEQFPELPEIVKQLLYDRGIKTEREIDTFLNPDYLRDVYNPFLFKDMQKAVNRLFDAIEKKELIVVHGDYDADGVCAAVILTVTLKELGAKTDIFLPHRETDGYGLNDRTVNFINGLGAKVIITCDCGISNGKEIDLGNTLGIDTIITDHHQNPLVAPNAFATIHPKVPGETYPDKTLAGGGVAFKLAQGLLIEYEKRNGQMPGGINPATFGKWLIDLVAISSVADMVPLLGETRTLVKYGLLVMNKMRRPGLKKIMQLGGIIKQHNGNEYANVGTHDIAFRIAPRINAAGRMNHANVAFNLLLSKDQEEIEKLAEELQQNNSDRQVLTEQLVKEAKSIVEKTGQENKSIIFILGPGWSTGIVGLIASKIKDVYARPTIVMGENSAGEITGSGRSINGFNLIKALQEMPQYFKKFGGHPQACGFSLTSPKVLEEFQNELLKKTDEVLKDIDLTPTINIDAEVSLKNVNWELFDVLNKFAPFGVGNPEPKYVAKFLKVHTIEKVGNDGKHIRIHVTQESGVVRKIIGFFCSDLCVDIKEGDNIDVIFEVGVNEWNGTRELQLKIVDLKKI